MLTELLEILKNHHDNGVKFDLGIWASTNAGCGTTACACGLHVINRPDGDLCFLDVDDSGETIKTNVISDYSWDLALKSSTERGFDAAAKFYGIPLEVAEYLFSPSWYHHGTLENVIKRVEHYIETGHIDYGDDL